jgi:hypothetical protein
MLRSLRQILGYSIAAADGTLGRVHDFYFDDSLWTIRHLVVNTGKWLVGRQVLIPPLLVGEPDWRARIVPVGLTVRQIRERPIADCDPPVCAQHRSTVVACFDWAPGWAAAGGSILPMPSSAVVLAEPADGDIGNPNLRSVREVLGYTVQGVGDNLGHIDDFLAATEDWSIRHLVVDTLNASRHRKVLITPGRVERVDWAEKRLHVDMTVVDLGKCPKFDPTAPVNRQHEVRLYDYYGRPGFSGRLERPRLG